MELDADHAAKVREIKHVATKAYYVPEGMTSRKASCPLTDSGPSLLLSDHSHAGLYPGNAKKLVDPKTLMNQGLAYKFKLDDLGKYSQRLKYKDRKFKKSALGKDIPEVDDRERRLARISLLKDMLRDAKGTDWYHTPLY